LDHFFVSVVELYSGGDETTAGGLLVGELGWFSSWVHNTNWKEGTCSTFCRETTCVEVNKKGGSSKRGNINQHEIPYWL